MTLKKLVNFVAVVAITMFAMWLAATYIEPVINPPKAGSNVVRNYSVAICDDAYKTDVRHENQRLAFFDVPLYEGCFSGLVALPSGWSNWQSQLIGRDSKDWVAIWWAGWDNPRGPLTREQLLTPDTRSPSIPSKYVRLEGHGTLRFYCVSSGGMRSCPIENSK